MWKFNFLIVWLMLIMSTSVILAQDDSDLEPEDENGIVRNMLLRSIHNFANEMIEK